ncbi:MAG: hypothetical protein Q8N08_09815 [Methanobacteriaceae archaeon]|nr:hypothetical protein [Methanobacteriaceae archaeon]
MGFPDPARQFGLEKCSCDWVLILDANELVPVKLMKKLKYIVDNDLGDIVSVPHNNYFFGQHMQTSGWGPLQDTHHRFFKKEYVTITNKIHSDFIKRTDARIYHVENPQEGFIHFNYIDFEHFIDKMNRYTTIEAKFLFLRKQNHKI